MQQRNLYIDFVKGLASLSVILIHTTFWSGQLYVPRELRTLSLLFDVPVFFLLSGFTSSSKIDKTFYRLIKMQITYMIFVTVVFLLVKIINPQECDLTTLGNWWLHDYKPSKTFPVVISGLWYLKTYFVAMFFGILILYYFPKYINWFVGLCAGLVLVFNFMLDSYPSGQVGYVVFYLSVFLLAHQLKGKMISLKNVALLYVFFFALVVWCGYYYGVDIFNRINKQKFPPKIPYIIASMLSLITVSVFYNRVNIAKDSFITYVGKNAIFYYFAQGISSTIIYFVVEEFKDSWHWSVLLTVSYVLNVVLAIFIAEILKKIDSYSWKILYFIKARI